jgi:hypothetical protein
MQEDIFRAPRLTPRGEGPVDGFDDIAPFTELSHCRFKLIGKVPDAGLGLARQPKAPQHLQASNAQCAIKIGAALACLRPEVEGGIVGLADHRAIDAGKAFGGDFCLKLRPQFNIRLGTKFQGYPFLSAEPQTIGDVVLGNNQVFAEIVLANWMSLKRSWERCSMISSNDSDPPWSRL